MQRHALIRIITFWRASISTRETRPEMGPPKSCGASIISKSACDCQVSKTSKLANSKVLLLRRRMALFGLLSCVQKIITNFKRNSSYMPYLHRKRNRMAKLSENSSSKPQYFATITKIPNQTLWAHSIRNSSRPFSSIIMKMTARKSCSVQC